MRAKHGSQLFVLVVATLLLGTSESRADFAQCTAPATGGMTACSTSASSCCTGTFTSSGGYNPLLIVMDNCHQPLGVGSLPSSGAPRKELGISSISRTGSTISVTTTVNHGASSGETVKIVGVSAALNGVYKLTSCGNSCNTFTATSSASGNIAAFTPPAAARAITFNLGSGSNPSGGWCGDSPDGSARIGGASADNGMMKAYGLVYRLMQHNIPVYWLVNPTKSPIALNGSQNSTSMTYLASDVDAWVLASGVTNPPSSGTALSCCGSSCTPSNTCTQPVHHLKNDLTAYADSYRFKEFPMRGGSFLIAPANRQAFNEFWTRTGAYSSLSSQSKYNWSATGIDLYEVDSTARLVYQNYKNGDGTTQSAYETVEGAPVAIKIDYEPARVACLGCGNNVPQAWLAIAGLLDPASPASCASGEFSPSDATFCLLNDYDVSQGTLVSGAFTWLWMFGYNDNSPCADSSEKAVFDKIRDFMTSIPAVRNAGHSIFLDDSIKVAEGCPNKQLLGNAQATTDGLDIKSSGAAEPYIIRYPNNLFLQFGDLPPSIAGGTVSGWNYFKSGSATIGYQTAFQVATSSLRRLMTVDVTGTSNNKCLRHDSTLNDYSSGTATTCDAFTPSSAQGDIFDVAAYGRLTDNLNNGLAYYLPGNQLNNSGNYAELRMLLNSLIALPDETFTTTPVPTEVSRSSPVVATVDGVSTVYTGTYERLFPTPPIPKATTTSGLSRFTFPYLQGHMRGIPSASFTACTGANCTTSNSGRTGIGSLSGAIFDAANGIPPVTYAGCGTNFAGNCRSVWTTTVAGRLPARVMFNTSNVSTLGPLMTSNLTIAEQTTLIQRILAGQQDVNGNWVSKLGGVDRSTPAVIGTSQLAGSQGRPTIVYFGALDGMMHAVCASVATSFGCDVVGRELWAYIPRTLLSDLKNSIARIDGSPHVIDAYGDFDNTGTNSWRTVLIFHTGTGNMAKSTVVPAVYAIDVTTPNNPKVLWEYSVTDVAPYDVSLHPNGRGTYEMGLALTISAGIVTISGTNKSLVFVQSNNGGTGGAASVLTAIDVETGAEQWQVADLYPTSGGKSARSSAHEAAPASGIPGGAVGIDKTGSGKMTHVVYADLYGDVFVRSADTGTNQQGGLTSGLTTPLLRIGLNAASGDYHPIGVAPAILAIGNTQYAAFSTGGYVDSQPNLWVGTNEATLPTQMVFAVNLNYTGTTISETNTTNVPIKFNLASGEGGFAQVMVVGNELFAVTDTTNVNSYDYGTSATPTGRVNRYNFGAATPAQETTLYIAGGAGGLFNDGTALISSSGAYGERTTADAISTTGTAVDPITSATATLMRKLWLRTE